MNGETVENKSLFRWRPNRSLAPAERAICFAIIAFTTLLVAGFAAWMGAWMVLPFAGAEAALVGLAFHVIGRHDNDFETLEFTEQEFRWTRNVSGRVTYLAGNRAWLQVRPGGGYGACGLRLGYAGRFEPLAASATEAERRALSEVLAGMLGHRFG